MALGTIIYDSALDCVRVYKSDGWSGCIGDSSGSSGSGGCYDNPAAASGLRFSSFRISKGKDNGGSQMFSTIGLTTSGDIYVWGRNFYGEMPSKPGSTEFARTPVKVNMGTALSAGEKIVKVLTENVAFYALTDTGKIISWGYYESGNTHLGNSQTATVSQNLTTANIATLPPGAAKFVDMAAGPGHISKKLLVVDDLGRAWITGRKYDGSGTYIPWTQLKTPAGTTAGFKYTKVWSTITSDLLEGNDGKYYMTGGNNYQYIYGNPAAPTTGTLDPTVAGSNIYQVLLPAGTAVKQIDYDEFAQRMIVLTGTGQVYAWGVWKMTGGSLTTTYFKTSDTSSQVIQSPSYFLTKPALVDPPAGETIIDISMSVSTTYLVAAGGKAYFMGGYSDESLIPSSNTNYGSQSGSSTLNLSSTVPAFSDWYPYWRLADMWTCLGIKEMQQVGFVTASGMGNFAIDADGKFWIVGTSSSSYWNGMGNQNIAPRPTPLVSGKTDGFNPNPEP